MYESENLSFLACGAQEPLSQLFLSTLQSVGSSGLTQPNAHPSVVPQWLCGVLGGIRSSSSVHLKPIKTGVETWPKKEE